MTKNKNTISINGKIYDAHSGSALDAAAAPKRPKNVDGVIRSSTTPVKPVVLAPVKIAPVLKPAVKKPVMDMARVPAKHAGGHKPDPAKTLMRRALQKPSPSVKRTVKAVGSTDALAQRHLTAIVPKASVVSLDGKRLAKATKTPQSKLITRFSKSQGSNFIAPTSLPPVETNPAPTILSHSVDIFEHAIATATSHQQRTPAHTELELKRQRRRARRGLNIAASSLAFLLLAGFVVFQNVNTIKMQVAASRAGFQAQLPKNHPSGFSVGNFTYQPGTVAVNYQSNSDDRHFAIVQKASSWDSQTLRENFVAAISNDKYTTTEIGGRTVYLYGDNNATWVNGGVWYQVETDGSLSQHQLNDLAASM